MCPELVFRVFAFKSRNLPDVPRRGGTSHAKLLHVGGQQTEYTAFGVKSRSEQARSKRFIVNSSCSSRLRHEVASSGKIDLVYFDAYALLYPGWVPDDLEENSSYH